jgi:hypothetical protein
MPTTSETIFNTVFYATEHTERPQAVLDYFKANDGKRLTAPYLKKMSETLGFEVTTHARASMTYVSFQNGDQKTDMIIAYALKNIVVDAKFFEEYNPAHLDAAVKRNIARAAVLSNQASIDELAAAIEGFKAAEARLKAAFEPFGHDRYTIERNFDLNKN